MGNLWNHFLGGAYSSGTVHKASKAGEETLLYNFQGLQQLGRRPGPTGGVIQDAEGQLQRAIYFGGTSSCFGQGSGTVFKPSRTGEETARGTPRQPRWKALQSRKVIQGNHGDSFSKRAPMR